ncbi:MAG: Rieske (2Fe-2S) protein [Leptolyngbyaceae cyanobacterium MO_188.B28]|nr:Rieske (2Fe-2S) protein [Leptolyngbyaceae cyanobacterium MO_188.B28]
MERRTFLKWVGVGGLASSLPVAIAACGNIAASPGPESGRRPGTSGFSNSGYTKVGTVSALDKSGRLRKKTTASSVLVIRDPNDSDTLHAVEPICTHQGCEVSWRNREQNIFCACHGSTFDPDGSVIRGPATSPLKSYPVKVEGNSILVKMS